MAELAAQRAAAQLLHRPAGARHPADVARAIMGAQAQDLRAGRLAFRARNARLRAGEVDRARSEERSLLRTWAMRRTMHLIAADDAGWLLPLFDPVTEAWSRRRLEQLGVEPAKQKRALREIERRLDRDGPLSRGEVVEAAERAGLDAGAQRRTQLVLLAVAGGIAYLGPDRGGQTCLVLRRDWLGEPPAFDREGSLRELARRYLRAFGPATEVDFAGWAGLPLRDVRTGLEGIAAEVREVRVGDWSGIALRNARRRAPAATVRLLPGWDTYLMGHRDRSSIAPEKEWRRINVGGGMILPAVVRDGAAVGRWRSKRSGRRLRVDVEAFRPLDAATRSAIAREVADVGRFEGVEAKLASIG